MLVFKCPPKAVQSKYKKTLYATKIDFFLVFTYSDFKSYIDSQNQLFSGMSYTVTEFLWATVF